MQLHRYWIEFDIDALSNLPIGVGLGCGVTAYDRDDALRLVEERVFRGQALPNVKSINENVDISQLDAGHVRPNMLNPLPRGIWFPAGYA